MKEKQDIQTVSGLNTFVRDVFGTAEVRMVLKDGTTISRAETRLLTLTDGSEVFEVVLS